MYLLVALLLLAYYELLLSVEGLGDDTDEELHEEHAHADDEHHRVGDHEEVVLRDWAVVRRNGVDGAPHDVDPAFSRLDGDQREHTRQSRVKVELRHDPLSSVVVAVPHGDNILVDLLRSQAEVAGLTVEELAREDGGLQDGEEEDEEENDDLQPHDVRDRSA